MLSRMCFGLVLVLITVLTKVIIFNFEDSQSDMAYAGKLFYVSQTLQGLSFTLVYAVSLEFTVAQSPVHTRGVMVGLWYTFGVLVVFLIPLPSFPSIVRVSTYVLIFFII